VFPRIAPSPVLIIVIDVHVSDNRRNETHQNIRETKMWMWDTNFLGKMRKTLELEKLLFFNNICFELITRSFEVG
jgi:hypothetical protein